MGDQVANLQLALRELSLGDCLMIAGAVLVIVGAFGILLRRKWKYP